MKSKMLRGVSGYRNQSATPGLIPFPGVARFYSHPVVSRRPAIRTSYVRLPMDDKVTKVRTRVMSMVLGARNLPVFEMELRPVFEPTLDANGRQVYDAKGQPATHPVLQDGQPVMRMQVKEAPVPVTKPARLDPRCPKGVYRSLKRLARRGVKGDRLVELGRAILSADKEVTK